MPSWIIKYDELYSHIDGWKILFQFSSGKDQLALNSFLFSLVVKSNSLKNKNKKLWWRRASMGVDKTKIKIKQRAYKQKWKKQGGKELNEEVSLKRAQRTKCVKSSIDSSFFWWTVISYYHMLEVEVHVLLRWLTIQSHTSVCNCLIVLRTTKLLSSLSKWGQSRTI